MSAPNPIPVATFTINPTVDLSLEVPALVPEGKTRARIRSVRAGGGGINVARCLRTLGGTALAVHTAGREVGARLNRLLDEERLPHVPIAISSDTREAFVVADDTDGRSYHIVAPGPVLTVDEERRCLAAVADTAQGCDYFVLSGGATPGLRDAFSTDIARAVRGRGAKLVADIAGTQLTTMLNEHVFLLRLDRREAAAILGRPISTPADAQAANIVLLDRGACDYAITTVGALGAVCSDRHGHHRIGAPTLPTPPRSDACAGDSLVAALTYRLVSGDSVARACEVGVAAAAATVLCPGTDVFDIAMLESLLPGIHSVHCLPR